MRRTPEYLPLSSSAVDLDCQSELPEDGTKTWLRARIPAPQHLSSSRGQALRRPNPYVNLDKVLQNVTYTFPPIVNFPPLVLQISTSDRHRTMREDSRQWHSRLGTVYPHDRHITVSHETSTILQFRNLDYAMERCVLTLTLPLKTDVLDPAISIHDPSILDVWVLNASLELSPHITGTWKHAPARRSLLATFAVSLDNLSLSGEFHCPSEEFTTLELACSSTVSACRVDFWQNLRLVPIGGIYITQSQSVFGGSG
ncbi:hypothetical protein BKA93DRAFT_829974 [Sparassis latifolia]